MASLSLKYLFIWSLYVSVSVSIVDVDPDYRQFSLHESNEFEYGYINLKAYPAKKLNISSFNETTTSTPSDCAINCIQSKKQCHGFNLVQLLVDSFNCLLLGLDMYTAYPHFIDAEPQHSYYMIDTPCASPRACPNENYWCTPNHLNRTYSCQCKYQYTGVDCMKNKLTTPILKLTSFTPDFPEVTKTVHEKVISFSGWFKFDHPTFVSSSKRRVFTMGLHPSYCRIINVFVKENNIILEEGIEIPIERVNYLHVGGTLDLVNLKYKIYVNGTHKFDIPEIQGYKPGILKHNEVFATIAGGYFSRCNSRPHSETGKDVILKEFYVWNRLLEPEDFVLLHKKKFLPYNPLITWKDFVDAYHNLPEGKINFSLNENGDF